MTGIGLKGGPGAVLDASSTDPVLDDGIGRYRYRMTIFSRYHVPWAQPLDLMDSSRSTIAIASLFMNRRLRLMIVRSRIKGRDALMKRRFGSDRPLDFDPAVVMSREVHRLEVISAVIIRVIKG